MRDAFLYPGQGSQGVGMGREWAEAFPRARETFEEADDSLGMALSRLCWEGPEDELQLTANTQPAILATSVAIHRVVDEAGLAPVLVAGHSLGEYSALVAVGTLELAEALALVRRRGELMQQAVPVGVGAMAAVLGLDAEVVEAVAEEASGAAGVCAVANHNAPGQSVISGHRRAVERASVLAQERGARRVLPLPVSAPFHSPLMAPAREALTPFLEEARFRDPRVPVVVNVDAAPVDSGEAAREALVRQVDEPVRWVESVEAMVSAGVERFLEVGPGNVLTGLGKRIAREVPGFSLATPRALDEVLERTEGGS